MSGPHEPVWFQILSARETPGDVLLEVRDAIVRIDPAFTYDHEASAAERARQGTSGAVRANHVLGNAPVAFGVVIWPLDCDVFVGIGARLRTNCPVLLLAPDGARPTFADLEAECSFMSHPMVFRFSLLEQLIAFVDQRIVRYEDSHSGGFRLPEGERALTGADVEPGQPVWFPCRSLWEPGIAVAVDDPGPYPTTVDDAVRATYRDCQKRVDDTWVALDDDDILTSLRRAWSEPLIRVDELGGNPHRNGAVSRRLRRRTS